MRIGRHPHDAIVARVPQMAACIDPVLRQLDALLDDDALSPHVNIWAAIYACRDAPAHGAVEASA